MLPPGQQLCLLCDLKHTTRRTESLRFPTLIPTHVCTVALKCKHIHTRRKAGLAQASLWHVFEVLLWSTLWVQCDAPGGWRRCFQEGKGKRQRADPGQSGCISKYSDKARAPQVLRGNEQNLPLAVSGRSLLTRKRVTKISLQTDPRTSSDTYINSDMWISS